MIKRGKNKERDVDNIKEIIKEIGIQKEAEEMGGGEGMKKNKVEKHREEKRTNKKKRNIRKRNKN